MGRTADTVQGLGQGFVGIRTIRWCFYEPKALNSLRANKNDEGNQRNKNKGHTLLKTIDKFVDGGIGVIIFCRMCNYTLVVFAVASCSISDVP